MTPEKKAAEYTEKIRKMRPGMIGRDQDSIYDAYLSGANADRWIAVTSDNIPKGRVLCTNKKRDYALGSIVDNGHGYLFCQNGAYCLVEHVTHYQLITPPNQTT